jgi:hypothetical protein
MHAAPRRNIDFFARGFRILKVDGIAQIIDRVLRGDRFDACLRARSASWTSWRRVRVLHCTRHLAGK